MVSGVHDQSCLVFERTSDRQGMPMGRPARYLPGCRQSGGLSQQRFHCPLNGNERRSSGASRFHGAFKCNLGLGAAHRDHLRRKIGQSLRQACNIASIADAPRRYERILILRESIQESHICIPTGLPPPLRMLSPSLLSTGKSSCKQGSTSA